MLEAVKRIVSSGPSVLFSRPSRSLAQIDLKTPVMVTSRGQKFQIDHVLLPETIAPYVDRSILARKLASHPISVGELIDPLAGLMVSASQPRSGSLVLDFENVLLLWREPSPGYKNVAAAMRYEERYYDLPDMQNNQLPQMGFIEKEAVPNPLLMLGEFRITRSQ